ncbi:MAG: DNA-binding NtrC family response regulator [Polaribacter sp.]|jgi:DNA-binding NtrC family response regulator
MKNSKILIIDDDRTVCTSISLLLKRIGANCTAVHQPKEALETLETFQPDLIILDMNFAIETSGKKGLEMLQRIREAQKKTPIILITGWATVQLAVQGMKLGANDFIAKPWDNKQLLNTVNTLLELYKKNSTAESRATFFEHIIGEETAFKSLLETAQRVSKTNASVLINGESGTGKELIAEAIHYESSRNNNPFIKVNLGGISSSLFESEMFGHKKGAFTDAFADRIGRFEMADSGTIFLDEIGDLELSSQVKLLRVLQEQTFEPLGSSQTKKIDIRVISATNKNLEAMVAEGTFREDLYYRINLIKIQIPTLVQRRSDIPLLAKFFINNLSEIYDRPLKIDREALGWLQNQNFPGNIRQLKNLVERTALISVQNTLTIKDFQQQYSGSDLRTGKISLPAVGSMSLEEMELQMIKKALAFHHHKISPTARALGITRSALYRRLGKYGIEGKD